MTRDNSTMDHGCADFARSSVALRRAMAGDGLPAVEPEAPLPAGTGMTRRRLLIKSVGLGVAVYGGAALRPDAHDEGMQAAMAAAGGQQRVLVSVWMPGGMDGLSLLAPVGDPQYRKLRPTVGLPTTGPPLAEDPRLAWHPAAAGLATLHAQGKVSILPAVGYANGSTSHFSSRHYWEVGEVNRLTRQGWLGRYLDRYGSPDNPLQGLSLDGGLSPTMATAKVPVAAFDDPLRYRFETGGVDGPLQQTMLDAYSALGRLPDKSPTRAAARGAVHQTMDVRRRVAAVNANPAAAFPRTRFGLQLSTLSALIDSGVPVRCAALSGAGGYDTHANQAATLTKGFKDTADALLAFQLDLERRGIADRVLVNVWSEFGRRAKDNNGGTDHGAAGVSLVIGSRARGGLIGEFPGLDKLDENGNVRMTSDYRGLYCSLLEQWLDADAAAIIPGAASFARPALLR